MVWCGVVRYGTVRSGAVQCGVVRYSTCYGVDLQLLKYIISDAYDVLRMLEMLSESKFVVLFYSTVYAAPSSHYEVSPIEKPGTVEANQNSHFYEMPVEEENPAFSNMDKFHDGAVVNIGLPNKSSYNPNAPVRYTAHRRSQPNKYHIPNIPGGHRTASGQADSR